MYRVLVADAVVADREALSEKLSRASAGFRVIADCGDIGSCLEKTEDYHPDIVFLDVSLLQEAGFGCLNGLHFGNFRLVCTAADAGYAFQALRHNAFDYLLKPVAEEDLLGLVRRMQQRLENIALRNGLPAGLFYSRPDAHPKIPIPVNKQELQYELPARIVRLEADSNYTRIILEGGRAFLVAKTLKQFDALLCGHDPLFLRVHHSHIINLRHVVRLLKEEHGIIVMKDGCSIPLAKAKRGPFMQWLETGFIANK